MSWKARWLGVVVLVLTAVHFGCATGKSGQDARSLYVTQNPETPSKFANAILNGNVLLGMSLDMVRAAWGAPTRIEKTPGGEKGDEKWIYGNYLVHNAVNHLYFRNDVVVLYEFVDTQTQATQSISDPETRLSLLSRAPTETGGAKGP
jgi:hypothetical protein